MTRQPILRIRFLLLYIFLGLLKFSHILVALRLNLAYLVKMTDKTPKLFLANHWQV